MQAYDVLMVIVLMLAVLWGAWKGLAWQIASIASIGLSYFVALRLRLPVAGLIDATPPWNMFLAMLILFLGTALFVWIGFNVVSDFIERVKLKEFDKQLGAVFGAAKGALLCVLITLFSVALLGDAQRQAICNSKSGYYIAVFLDRTGMMIPHELHGVLAPYLDRLDRSIPHPHISAESHSDWRHQLQANFGGPPAPGAEAPTLQPSFPAGPEADRVLVTPHTAGRIEAHPTQPPTSGSFRRR
jgi:membrane protein required for colicin V production